MKISCDACQAKYSISDDKLQGKVFKIRCKRCNHIVIVRGVVAATSVATAPATDVPDAPWHLAIDGEQEGPLTAAQVQDRITSGEIDAHTLGWREGFSDWSALADIDAFAVLVKPATGTRERVSPAIASPGSAGARSTPGGSAQSIAATAAANVATSSETGVSQRLRSERNESSVLFSLSNLAQVAQTVHSSPRRVPAATPANATPTTPTEGSGLIDIRSLATAYLDNEPAARSSASSSNIGSFADLPTFATNAFTEPNVLVPLQRSPRERKLVIGAITALSLLAIAVGVLVMLLGRGSRDVAAVPVAPTEPNKPAVTQTPDVTAATPAVTTAPTTSTAAPTTTPEKKVDKKTPSPTTQPISAARPSTPSRPATPATPPALTPTPVAASEQCEEVQCVLDGYPGACCAKYRHTPAPTPTPNPTPTPTNAPDSLDRAMISTGIDAVKARVMACGNKSPAKGKVTVKVFVAANGSVKSVNVEETPDPALGACVVSNVQKATFGVTKTGGSFRMPFTF